MTTTEKNINELSVEELEQFLNEKRAEQVEAANKKRQSYEQLKETTINTLCEQAELMNGYLERFKRSAFNDLDAIYQLLQEYSTRHDDGKGNFTLENEAKTFKVVFARQQLGYFDERADQAEKHIIDFVNKQFAGDAKTKKLITSLLERKKSKLDIKLVQKLYAMENDYDDANWKEGIRLLKESWQPSESRDYVRFFKKVDGAYRLINLNISSINLSPIEPKANENSN